MIIGENCKPKAGSKCLREELLMERDLMVLVCTFRLSIWISEVVEFIAEWRCFVV